MNEASTLEVADPSVVALTQVPPADSSNELDAREAEAAARSADDPRLGRALLISLGLALLLAAVAFWPSAPEPIAPRPKLQAPIVFDVLNAAPLPKAYPESEPAASPTAPAPGKK